MTALASSYLLGEKLVVYRVAGSPADVDDEGDDRDADHGGRDDTEETLHHHISSSSVPLASVCASSHQSKGAHHEGVPHVQRTPLCAASLRYDRDDACVCDGAHDGWVVIDDVHLPLQHVYVSSFQT